MKPVGAWACRGVGGPVMEVSKGHVKALELLRQVGATGEALGLTDWGRPFRVVQACRWERPG